MRKPFVRHSYYVPLSGQAYHLHRPFFPFFVSTHACICIFNNANAPKKYSYFCCSWIIWSCRFVDVVLSNVTRRKKTSASSGEFFCIEIETDRKSCSYLQDMIFFGKLDLEFKSIKKILSLIMLHVHYSSIYPNRCCQVFQISGTFYRNYISLVFWYSKEIP